jgi:ribonuclease HI
VQNRSAINLIIAGTSLSGNCSTLKANSTMTDFVMLRAFSVKMNFGNAPNIKEVLWQPPIMHWLKCNIDGASNGNPGPSACGGIFRDSNADFIGAFAFNLGTTNSLSAELHGAMFAIEIAAHKGWNNLWLETDSLLVTLAFKSSKVVPWSLRNRWANCMTKAATMNFFVTHVYREGNCCADILANIGLSLQSHAWWDHVPSQVGSEFNRNRLGMTNYRFS